MEAYKERFIKEYAELDMRLYKLEAMLNKWEKGELNFTPDCPKELLERQAKVMTQYRSILEERAKEYENIPLPPHFIG